MIRTKTPVNSNRLKRSCFRLVKLSFALILLLLPQTFNTPAQAADASRPNVILILADDQGSVDLNCYGAKDLATPHLDKLASSGVRFTQFYAAAPVCSPSRAAVLTGRVPQRAGVPGNVPSQPGGSGMPVEQVTIAEMMKAGGYKTAHIGKWHLGYSKPIMPNGQGFDFSFGHMGGCIDNFSHFFYWNGPNRHDLWRNGQEIWADGQFFPEMMVKEASELIEKNKQQPFFMYWAINVPHYPLQGTDRWRKHYADMEPPRRMYAAFVSTMDEMIGQLIAKVDKAGLRENTIIIYQSDHGHSTEIRTFGGGGSAGPYRGAKFSLFEGGIRVPAIISWPGQLPKGAVRDQFAVACDWLPTISELCNVDLPKRKLDGKSLVNIVKSNDARPEHQVFHWQSGGGKRPQWSVRDGDWKLIGNPRDTSNKAPITNNDSFFLVNLAESIDEMKNIASEHPDRVKRMKQLHDDWIKEVR